MAEPVKVLVVDDTEPVRRTLIAVLNELGYQARGAEHGLAALQDMERALPDLVLCDLRMPVMDGVALLEATRVRYPRLPLIVMSGAGLLDDAVAALKAGAWDYITKPIVEVEVLRHAVDKALERARLLEENSRQKARLEAMNRELRATVRALAEDEDAGRQLQFRMLPKNHQHFGAFEFSRELLPSAYLSGDFVDAFAIDEQRWGFYLADVAGHGVSSALVTVVLRARVLRQLDAFTRQQDPLVLQPGRLLTALNQTILEEPLEKHLTMFYGVIDLAASTLTYANAGHFPSPVLFEGGAPATLTLPGLPLGILPAARYEERVVHLGPHLVLSAFSDGLLEALPQPSLEAKLEFLGRLFGRFDVTLERARQSLHLDQQLPLPDDVTLLLIKRGAAHAA